MAVYIVVTRLRTRNPAEIKLYADQAPAFLVGRSIKWLARFGRCEVKEGPGVEAIAILEFRTIQLLTKRKAIGKVVIEP